MGVVLHWYSCPEGGGVTILGGSPEPWDVALRDVVMTMVGWAGVELGGSQQSFPT